MLTPHEALERILESVEPLREVERVPLQAASGRVTAAPVDSDVDLPPFEKSAMDGFAVCAADFAEGEPGAERSLPRVGESRAGTPWEGVLERGACVAIYTGAELPRGADGIVIVEHTRESGARDAAGNPLIELRGPVEPGQHVCHRGQDLAVGARVFEPGRRVRGVDLALLAAVGAEPLAVVRRPRVAILTSGDELVPPTERPGPGQIREGNTLHLAAMSVREGAEVVRRGVVADDPAALREAFADALAGCDVLLTTGGVSMGRYDLVGEALAAVGVEARFHRVAIKPGKPLWFGVRGRVPVFALPGNPVSCLVNHAVFVAPALRKLGGEVGPLPTRRLGRWEGSPVRPNPREQYLPVRRLRGPDGVERLESVRWNGSADVVGIARAKALAVVAADTALERGALVPWFEL
ncbi:MAG TPA: gephyrin-like molybdotransferase Glp [Planctomycetota bacterium]|nr:gephyrin-like molybdotransferase Glp [Planctomycetota bacterium]